MDERSKDANTKDLMRKITITLPYKDLDTKVSNKLSNLAKQAKVAGFRPGKAPIDVVKQQYGEELLKEVATGLMKECFLKLAIEQQIKLAGVLSIQEKVLAFDKDFIYEVEYEVYPEIDVAVPKDLNLEIVVADVSDEDIDNTIEDMRKKMARYEDTIIGIDAKPEHLAVVSYTAMTNDTEGQTFSADGISVDLSTDHPSAEFVAAIIGMKAGEQKHFTAKVTLSLNKDLGDANQATDTAPKMEEREVNFKLTLDKLQRRILPEVNQDFFKQYGVDGSEKDFREQLKTHMTFELQRAISRIKYKSIAKSILETHKDLQVPNTQLMREASRMRDATIKMWSDMSGDKNTPDRDSISLDMFKDMAYEKISAGLFLSELAKSESLTPSATEVEEAIATLTSSYDEQEKKQYQESEEFREQIYNKLLEEKAMDKFIAIAGAQEKRVKYQEALAMSASLAA